MTSQQDQQNRSLPVMDGKVNAKRPFEGSPPGMSAVDSGKPAQKLQKLDMLLKEAPIGKLSAAAPAPGGSSLNSAGGYKKQGPPSISGGFISIPRKDDPQVKATAPSGNLGVASAVNSEGKKSPTVGEQPPTATVLKKVDGAVGEGKPLHPSEERSKVTRAAEDSTKVQKPEPVEVHKAGNEGGAAALKEVTEGEKDDGKREKGGEEGMDKGRRILRPRQASAPPQGQRSRLRHRDGEAGSPGLDHSLQYKEGAGVAELGAAYDSSPDADAEGRNLVEVRIPPEAVTLTNKQVRARQLWGTDVYTDDSDMVAVLMHAGYYTPSSTPPPPSVVELRVVVRLLPSQEGYPSSARNNIRSRAWGAAKGGCSFRVDKCWVVKSGGGTVDLEPSLSRNLAAAPTLVPAATERTVTTRSSAQAASNRQRYLQEVTVQYNLCNEPWLKYSLSAVADRGLKPSQFTSSRLKKGDVLYLETHTTRFELSYVDQSATSNGTIAAPGLFANATSASSSRPSSSHGLIHTLNPLRVLERPGTPQHDHPTYEGEKYRFAKCKRALPLGVMRKKGIPLPAEELEIVEDGVIWENVEWSPSAIWVRGQEFPLTRVQFMSKIVPLGS